MATLEQIGAALKAADAAGNTDDARRLAQAYAQMRDAQQGPQMASNALPTVTVKAPDRLPGVLGDINDFGNDLGDSVVHHLGNIPVGLAQVGAHSLRSFVNAGASTAPDGSIGQRIASYVNDKVGAVDAAVGRREATYQQNVPDSSGSYIGAGIGEVLPWMVGAGEARTAALIPRAATRLGRLGMAATEGATMGATQPVTSGDYGSGKLEQMAIGGVAAPIAYGTGSAANKLVSATKNVNRLGVTDRAAADILTREADNPAVLTRPAPSRVPGVKRTLAEETLDPGIARIERNLRSTNKQFDAIDRSNNASRVSQLERIAGSDADMEAAIEARNASTGALRDTAFKEGAGFDAANAAQRNSDQMSYADKVKQIEQRNANRRSLGLQGQEPIPTAPPESSPKEALQSRIGEVIAKNNGNPAVQTALSVVGGALRQADDSVPGLYNVRKYVGDLLSGRAGGDTVSAKAASRELIDIRDAIDGELQRRAPSFSKYLTAYQDASKPINRMEVGQDFLKSSSGSAVLDPVTGSQVLTPAQFSKKVRNLDLVAARATGFKKAKASDILSPSDISSIKAIQDDLERQAFRATAGSGGNSQTFERGEVQKRISRGVGREALRHVPAIGRYAGDFLDMLDKSRNERVKERLAYLVANPEEARRVLAALPPSGQKIVDGALTRLGAPTSRLATQPTGQQQGQ